MEGGGIAPRILNLGAR